MTKATWIIIAGVAFVVVFLVALQGILFPFIAAFAVAYFLDPLCDRLEKAGLGRTAATALVTAVFFVVLAGFIAFIAPILYGELLALVANLPDYWQAVSARLKLWQESPLFASVQHLWDDGDYGKDIASLGLSKLQSLPAVLSGFGGVLNFLSLWIITPVVAFYLLRDWDKLVAAIDDLLPKKHRADIRTLTRDIDKALSGYLRGQLSVCVILGVVLGVCLWGLGLPYGFIIGFASGLLSFIPYVGQIIGAVVACGVAYATTGGWVLPLSVIGVFVGGNLLEGMVLVPRFVGQSIGVHAVWVLFALLAAASLLGFVGLLLALPLAACLSVLVRFAVVRYKQGKFYNGKK